VSAGERAAPELAGRSFAVAGTVVFLISAAAAPPLGALAEHVGWDTFWATMAGVAAVGAVIATGLRRTVPG
jgi:sugar phosphate permease